MYVILSKVQSHETDKHDTINRNRMTNEISFAWHISVFSVNVKLEDFDFQETSCAVRAGFL